MDTTQDFNPEATAISRARNPSAAYTVAHTMFQINGFQDVLDYGCGRGEEADQYAYDKLDKYRYGDEIIRSGKDNVSHGHMKKNFGVYDYVICSCVLNTIPTVSERAIVISNIYQLLNRGGKAIISVFTGVPKLDKTDVPDSYSRWGDGWKIECRDGVHFQTLLKNSKIRNLISQVIGSGNVKFINTGRPGCIVFERIR